ncbi:MAG: zinc-ribbon domain-containing protein [Lachnospiraceae bacterium]|nr:zinc-ribbon domain-containing protein [Lachnospiraceae bacterium]
MKEKFMRFMYGRYGIDTLGKYMIGAALVTIVFSNIFDSSVFAMLSWGLIILAYFRMFSRDIYKRSGENQTFLNKTFKMRRWLAVQKNMFSQRKTHHIYHCPGCRQKIRVPKGKGRIEIRCPKCNTTFIKNS